MKKIFLQAVIVFISLSSFAQGINIKGCVKGMPYTKIYFAEIISGRMHYLDSTIANNGCFGFTEADTLEKGLYSIVLNAQQNAFIRILLNNERNIEFSTSFSKMSEDMNFTASAENQWYYSYNKENIANAAKADLLQKLLAQYKPDDKIYGSLKEELNKANVQNEHVADQIYKDHPKSLAAALIRAQQNVVIPAGRDTVPYLREHLLDQLDFSNTVLLRSGMLASGILKTLSLSESNDYTYNEQVESYVKALDNILHRAAVNDTVFGQFRTELSGRYKYGNYDILGAYLTKYYPGSRDSLPAVADVAEIRKRLSSLHHVSAGVQAPDIQMPTYDGKTTGLSDINSDYTLLVFWSTGCYHCTQMLPELKKLYSGQKAHALEVLAVSFDTDKKSWQDFVKDGNYSWINYSDLKGWQSDIAKAYDVQGTPTYILLDRGKTVIYKPATLEELVAKLKQLNVI